MGKTTYQLLHIKMKGRFFVHSRMHIGYADMPITI